MRGLLAWPGTCFLRGTGRESTDERAIGLVMPATALSSFNRSDSLGCTRSTRMPFTHTTCCQFGLIADSPSLCVCFCITRLAGTSGFWAGGARQRGSWSWPAHPQMSSPRRIGSSQWRETRIWAPAATGFAPLLPVSRRFVLFRLPTERHLVSASWWWAARRFGVLRAAGREPRAESGTASERLAEAGLRRVLKFLVLGAYGSSGVAERSRRGAASSRSLAVAERNLGESET